MSSNSDNDSTAPVGSWPSSLTLGQTEDHVRFGLYVLPVVKVPRLWRISTDGYATQGPSTTEAELRIHLGGWWNIKNQRHFWNGKQLDNVITLFKCAARGLPADATGGAGPSRPRGRARAAVAAPAIAPTSADVAIPLEQAALQQDGDPEDTPGFLAALARSAEEAAEEAASLSTTVAAAAVEDEDWDISDDDDGGGDGGGDGDDAAVINLAISDDEEE